VVNRRTPAPGDEPLRPQHRLDQVRQFVAAEPAPDVVADLVAGVLLDVPDGGKNYLLS
jgi:hypothetical protein